MGTQRTGLGFFLVLGLGLGLLGAPAAVFAEEGPLPLGDLSPASQKTGWFGVLTDQFSPGFPFVLDGQPVRGILTHAPAEVLYKLDGRFDRLQSRIGLYDSGKKVGRKVEWNGGTEFRDSDGRVRYQVWADDKLVFESPELDWKESMAIDVELAGCSLLRLVVLPLENNFSDWALWANPILLPRQSSPGIAIDGGRVLGVAGRTPGVKVFKGIPYAAPPIGNLRWKAPAPVVPWSGILLADRFGPSPIQGVALPEAMWTEEFQVDTSQGTQSYSEDCLTLNVWTTGSGRRPVIVYIPGGAFRGGGGNAPLYDGENLATRGVVLVTLNYRVGIFGFLAHPGLSAESSQGGSGNYGLLDQIAALKWVKRNIAAFGGDPSLITVAGGSAGGGSVQALMTSPLAAGLFQRAIALSFDSLTLGFPGLHEAESYGSAVVNGASVTQLRAMTAAQLLAYSFNAIPVIDGSVLTQSWHSALRSHSESPIPLLSGAAVGDRILFPVFPTDWNLDFPDRSLQEYRAAVNSTFGPLAADFLRLYPAADDAQAARQFAAITDDSLNVKLAVFAGLRSSRTPTFLYHFSHSLPDATGGTRYGAFHGSDAVYWQGNFASWRFPYLTPEDYALSEQMMGTWVRFATTGDPNGGGLPRWEPYATGSVAPFEWRVNPGTLIMDPAKVAAWFRYYADLR